MTDNPHDLDDAAAVLAEAEALVHLSRPPDGYQWRGHEGRTLVARWLVAEHPGGATGAVELACSHWKTHKAYSATLNNVEVQPDSGTGFVGTLSSPMDAVRVASEPVARFNRAKLLAFAESTIAAVRNPDHPLYEQIRAKFARAQLPHQLG